MRQIVLVFLAMTVICMPLSAQDNAAADGASAGCGKIMMGSFGEAPLDGEVDGTTETESATGLYYEDSALYATDPSAAAASESEMVDGTCDPPNADGTLTCYEGGIAYDCYCCDVYDQPSACNDVDPPCCIQ